MWMTLRSGLGAGGVGLLIDIVFTSGVLGIMEFRVTQWFFFIGLCVGALMDITSYLQNKNASSKIERLKSYSASMKNTEVYRRLISYDRQNILRDIREKADKNTTKDNNPQIDVGSTIPRGKDALNGLLSNWGFQDLLDNEYVQLKLAIAFTEGYSLISSKNYYDFSIDIAYWQKYIDSEIAKYRKIALDEYLKDQAGKKSIYSSSTKTTFYSTKKNTVVPKRASASSTQTTKMPGATTKQNYSSAQSSSVDVAVKAFEDAYASISKNKSVFGSTSIMIVGKEKNYRISFLDTGKNINDKNINLIRPSGFKVKNINGIYSFSFDLPYADNLEKETIKALKKKHPDWIFSGNIILVN